MSNNFEHDVAGSVQAEISMRCFDSSGRSHHLDTVFSYNESDPYAVTITFVTPEGDLPWTFGRELLITGLSTPSGNGDVHVCPSTDNRGRGIILIELSSPDGHLTTEAPIHQVQCFLDDTLTAIPDGEEAHHLDVDALIAGLLAP
jgi:hypothetical protein